MALYKGTTQIAGGSSVQNGNIHLSDIYPIGSIYTSITNSDNCPFEGIDGMHWEKIASGKCLFGADETHTISTEISAGLPLPSINTSSLSTTADGSHSHSYYKSTSAMLFDPSSHGLGADNTGVSTPTSKAGSHTHNITGSISFSNDDIYGKSTTVQPPAIAVIFWERKI